MSQNWDLPKDTIICKCLMEIHLKHHRLHDGVAINRQIQSRAQLKNFLFIFKQTHQVITSSVKWWPEVDRKMNRWWHKENLSFETWFHG